MRNMTQSPNKSVVTISQHSKKFSFRLEECIILRLYTKNLNKLLSDPHFHAAWTEFGPNFTL